MKKCVICALVIILSISVLYSWDCEVDSLDGYPVVFDYYPPWEDTVCYIQSLVVLITTEDCDVDSLLARLESDGCEVVDSILIFGFWEIEIPVDIHVFDYCAVIELDPNVDFACPVGVARFHGGDDGIFESPKNLPESVNFSIYPNPFNDAVKIKFQGDISIKIFDAVGRKVWSFKPDDDKTPQSSQEISWIPEPDLPTGIYLVKASNGNESVSKQVMYLK